MPDKTTLERREEMLADSDRTLRELGLLEPDPRPELRSMPTGDAAPASRYPGIEQLDAAVAHLEALAGKRSRAKLTVVEGGRDDA